MSGKYQPGEEKVLSGAYSYLKSFITEQTTAGERGKVAIPVVADWGPIGEFVTVKDKQQAVSVFGEVDDFELVWAANPRPSEVLLYRVAGDSAKAAEITLKNGATDCLKVTAKYKGAFGNRLKVVVQTNLLDAQLVDVSIYMDADLVESHTSGTADGLLSAFSASDYVMLAKLADALPSPTAGTDLTGGDSGTTVEAVKYTNYLAGLETKKGNYGVFTLGVADESLIAAAQEWTEDQRAGGNYIKFVFGGDSTRDQVKAEIKQASLDANHMAVVNVGSGVEWEGKTYPSYKVAVYIASLMAAMPLNHTMALFITPFDRLTKEWAENTDLKELVTSGTLMLNMDEGSVIIQEPVNTLTVPADWQSKDFGKIRVVDTFDAILSAEERAGKKWIQQQPNTNTPATRSAFSMMIQNTVLLPLANLQVIAPDYEHVEDPLYHGDDAPNVPSRSAGHFVCGFKHQDALEKIYTYNKAM